MADAGPLVSIVLPVYNGARLLRGSIDSCLNQTYKNFELIIIDDCSTDNTPDIIKSYKDPRIHYFRNEKNQRLPRSLNVGFSRTKGEYLTWTSDDNEYFPEALERMLECFKANPGVDFVYTDQWTFYEKTGEKVLQKLPDELDLKEVNVMGGSFMYTRRVYEAVGDYNPYYEMVEDYDYWIRITQKFRSAHCPHAVYLYRFQSQALTSTRSHDQDLFRAIMQYRHGFIPLSKLGWTAAHYFDNIKKSDKTPEEKEKLTRFTKQKISKLSFGFSVLFNLSVAYFLAYKFIREAFKKEGKP